MHFIIKPIKLDDLIVREDVCDLCVHVICKTGFSCDGFVSKS